MSEIMEYLKGNLFGTLTVVFSLTFIFLGLPDQIWKLWKGRRESVKNISLAMFALLTIQSAFWVLYGIQQKDWFVVAPNIFGALFGAIVVLECLFFRRRE